MPLKRIGTLTEVRHRPPVIYYDPLPLNNQRVWKARNSQIQTTRKLYESPGAIIARKTLLPKGTCPGWRNLRSGNLGSSNLGRFLKDRIFVESPVNPCRLPRESPQCARIVSKKWDSSKTLTESQEILRIEFKHSPESAGKR